MCKGDAQSLGPVDGQKNRLLSISCVLQACHADIQPAAVHIPDSMRDAESQVDKGRVCGREQGGKDNKKKKKKRRHAACKTQGCR